MAVDKDLLNRGNKEYAPDKCCILPEAINSACAETVPYTLYKMVEDEHGSHGETIIDSESIIWWDNVA